MLKRYTRAGFRIARAWFRASGKSAYSRSGFLSAAREHWRQFTAFVRMLRAWAGGRYRGVPVKTLLLSAIALLYFVSPIDLITDFIPIAGLLDDVTVVLLVLSAVSNDLERFQAWEDRQRHTIDAENPASAIL